MAAGAEQRILAAVEQVGAKSASFDARLAKLEALLGDRQEAYTPSSKLPRQDLLNRLTEVESAEAEAEACAQNQVLSPAVNQTVKLERQEQAIAVAAVRSDVEVLQRLQGRSHSDIEAFRSQIATLTSALPRVEAAVRSLSTELQGLQRQQTELSSSLKAEAAERARAEDQLGQRCWALEAIIAKLEARSEAAQAVLEERNGAAEKAAESLREVLREGSPHSQGEEPVMPDAHEKKLHDLVEVWQSNSQSLKHLQEDFRRFSKVQEDARTSFASRCDALESFVEEQRKRWQSTSTDCGSARASTDSASTAMGAEPSKHSRETTEAIPDVKIEEKRLLELSEEVASLGAQQQLHTLLIESIRRDVEWSERVHRASMALPS